VGTDGATPRSSLLELEGTVFDGRFRIEERIAEGGFAVVYKAWQVALDRRVALKVLKTPRGHDEVKRAEFREKFAAEAKTIARLRHPHIVDVYDFSVSTLPSGELAPWMALEWLEGETLAVHLGRRRRAGERGRDPLEAVDLLRPVMLALAHAHGQGIVHRDVKPSNIMVTETAHGPALRVLDFGIAKIVVDDRSPNTGNTRTESSPAFSPAYAAPEQVAFSRTGPWTDVHALGLVLSEVMTDEPPFSDPDPEAHLFEQVMSRRRPTPAGKGRDVGPFEPIIAKALNLSPRDRWRNAGELLAALEDAAEGRQASPATATEVAGDDLAVARRPRRLGRVAAMAVVAVVTVVGGGWVFLGRRESPASGPPAVRREPARAAAVVVEPAPTTPAAAASPVVAAAPPPTPQAAALGKGRRKNKGKGETKTKEVAAPALVDVGDGRALFNDTK